MGRILQTTDSLSLTVLRLALGAVMFPHGAQKMLGWFGGNGFSGTMGGFQHMGIPAVFAFLAVAAEFFGGLGLIAGFLSRIAGFGILCNMAVAILKVHASNGLFMNWTGQQKGEGFEFHLLAMAISVAVLIGGGGAFSVDRALARRGR
jgi:putative oxidoreductase